MEARQAALMAASLDAVLFVGTAGVIREANLAAERLFGVPQAQLAGRLLVDLVRFDGRGALQRLLAQAAQEGRACAPSMAVVRGDASEAIVELSLGAVSAAGATAATEVVVVARDVTERVRLERQLHESERLATVGTLAAGIAHEIANPATYVRANLALVRSYEARLRALVGRLLAALDDGAATREALGEARADFDALLEEVDEVLRESEAGSERIGGIVGDLKAFFRAEDAVLQPLRLEDELEAALRLARGEIRFRATVQRDYAPELPVVIGHPARISQLLLNLVLNAAQAMERGGPADNVLSVATSVDGEGVRVDVRDTGPGIAPEVLPGIFEPSFATRATRPTGKGSGLGLAISRDIARRHGGEIRVSSSLGRGTRFSVWLPLRPPVELNPAASAAIAMFRREALPGERPRG